MYELIGAVLVVLLASAICSGSEAALFSVSMVRVRQLAQNKKAAAIALLSIRKNMNRPIATIVIFNNVASIVGSIEVGSIAQRELGGWLGYFSALLTFLVIFFSEIIPKTLGERHADTIALWVARPLQVIVWMLTPLLWALEKMASPFTSKSKPFSTNESEIKLLTRLGQKEGIIQHGEGEMIQKVFELNDLTASDLLTPRVVMTWLRGAQTLAQSKDAILDSPHNRIIIVGDRVDDILGFALKADLLKAMIEGNMSRAMFLFANEVRFVPRQIKADQLLLSFRRTRQHIAVVLDEFGGVAGVISLEDVLEVLTGAIMDETDQIEDMQEAARLKQLSHRTRLNSEKSENSEEQAS